MILTCPVFSTGYACYLVQVRRGKLMNNVKKKEVLIGYERSRGKALRTITDYETGEIISEMWIEERKIPTGRPQGGKKAHFFKVYVTNWRDIIRKKKLDFTEIGLLCSLLSFVGWQTAYLVNPDTGENLTESKIADLLSCSRSHVHVILERLIEKGLIAKVVNGKGRANQYMINTNVFFFGNTISDIREHKTFNTGCEYEPIVEIKYRQSAEK